jgi:4-azaleucine resistance transporter AzlC
MFPLPLPEILLMENTLPTTRSRGQQFWSGLQAILPILLGVLPFGMIYGAVARQSGISLPAAQSMSFIVFAGSSQFIAAQLFQQAVPGLVIVLTFFIVNLRHALYSASVAGYTRRLHLGWKLGLAYLLTDEAYAVAVTHYQKEGNEGNQHYYFLGAGLTLWAGWQISTAAGIFLGAVIPSTWSLDFALPLTFIALVVPALKDRAGTAAALAGGIMALLAFSLPYKLGILVAALVGISAGLLVEGKS